MSFILDIYYVNLAIYITNYTRALVKALLIILDYSINVILLLQEVGTYRRERERERSCPCSLECHCISKTQ